MSSPKEPGFALQALQIAGIGCIACAQPLLDLLGRNPEFFSARGTAPSEILAFTALLCLFPLLVFLPIGAIVGRRLRYLVFLCTLWFLCCLSVLPALRSIGVMGTWPVLGIATLAATVVVAIYVRRPFFRSFFTFLALSLAAVPATFLFMTPVKNLIRPRPIEPVSLNDEIAHPFPIVLLVFDELATVSLLDSKREIDERRLPGFARLAEMSSWYPNAATISVNTVVAVPAILTGMKPKGRQLPIVSSHPQNIITLLAEDYESEIFETLTQLCPESICGGDEDYKQILRRSRAFVRDTSIVYLHAILPESLAKTLPAIDTNWSGFGRGPAEAYVDRAAIQRWMSDHFLAENDPASLFRAFVDSLQEGRRRLYIHHSMLPHVPWSYLPSGRIYGPTSFSNAPHGISRGTWSIEPMHSDLALQRYLLQLGFADRLLGELLDALEQRKILDEALLIVTADHGLSFRPGIHRRDASNQNYSDVLPVPLFIKMPGVRERKVDDRRALTVDILPTVLDLLDVSAPKGLDGVSLLGPRVERKDLEVYRDSGAQSQTFPWPHKHRFDLLDRMEDLFGELFEPEILSGWPESKLWIGKRIADLKLAKPVRLLIALDKPSIMDPLERDEEPLPIHVTGSIPDISAENTLELAIALRGTIRATARTFDFRGSPRFSAFVPESSLVQGDLQAEFFLIRKSGCPGKVQSCLHPISEDGRLLDISPPLPRAGSPSIFEDGFETGSIGRWLG